MQSSWDMSLSISVSRNCLVNLYFLFTKKRFGDYTACSGKVQRLRDQALPSALEAWSLNHWTLRKVLHFSFFK